MKRFGKNLLVIICFCWSIACTAVSQEKPVLNPIGKGKSTNPKKEIGESNVLTPSQSDSLKLVAKLQTRDGEYLADLYVMPVVGEIFESFLIGKVVDGTLDTLYSVNSHNFKSGQNIELTVNSSNFYGYKFALIKDDYIVFHLLRDEGEKISDNMTIKWDYSLNKFKRLVLP